MQEFPQRVCVTHVQHEHASDFGVSMPLSWLIIIIFDNMIISLAIDLDAGNLVSVR